MINSTTRPVPSRRSRPDSPLKNPTDFPEPISGSVQDDLMLAPNQPRESMWLHKKFYPPSYPRENLILGPGLNKDALTSRCDVSEVDTDILHGYIRLTPVFSNWPQVRA